MKRLSGTRRTTSNLSDSVHHPLNMYALAASAAGVGMLALSPPAEAKIVYTPTHITIVGYKGSYTLDLNHDGTPDFNFWLHSAVTYSAWIANLKVEGSQRGNEIWSAGTSHNVRCAAALPKEKEIGPTSPFGRGDRVMFFASYNDDGGTSFCPWRDVKAQAFLGLKFVIKRKIHFGWARLGNIRTRGGTPTATLTGYTYETIPNKPIITAKTKGPEGEIGSSVEQPNPMSLAAPIPEPAMLGLLATGSPGLSVATVRSQ